MSAIGVRNSSIKGYKVGVKTGLIFRTYSGIPNQIVDSNAEVPSANNSTAVLGHANAPSTALVATTGLQQAYAGNARQSVAV